MRVVAHLHQGMRENAIERTTIESFTAGLEFSA